MKYIFLLNMGGAANLDECAEFLKNMFSDPNILRVRQPWRWLLGRCIASLRAPTMRRNYREIGGRSRLNALQSSLCAKISAMANSQIPPYVENISSAKNSSITPATQQNRPVSAHSGVVVDFISTYLPPRARDVLAKYPIAPSDEIVLLPLYPHFSTTTTRSSVQDFCRAFAAAFAPSAAPALKIVPPFFADATYNQLLISRAKSAATAAETKSAATAAKSTTAAETKSAADADVLVISAHSLPESIVRAGDPYASQIEAHFALLKAALSEDFAAIELGYQSRLGPVKWLSPSTAQVLARHAGRPVVVLPLSFCIDCSETDFELAIEYAREHERTLGQLAVSDCANDSDEFAALLLRLAQNALPIEEFDYINGELPTKKNCP